MTYAHCLTVHEPDYVRSQPVSALYETKACIRSARAKWKTKNITKWNAHIKHIAPDGSHLTPTDSGRLRLWTTPVDSGRLQMTLPFDWQTDLDNSRQLRTSHNPANNSRRRNRVVRALQRAHHYSGRLRIMLVGPKYLPELVLKFVGVGLGKSTSDF